MERRYTKSLTQIHLLFITTTPPQNVARTYINGKMMEMRQDFFTDDARDFVDDAHDFVDDAAAFTDDAHDYD